MSNNNDDFNVIVGEEPAVNDWDLDSYKRKEEWEKRKKEWEEKHKKDKDGKNNYKEARYRCEQLNISRINGEIITLSADIKTQYLFQLADELLQMRFILEDFIFSVEPNYFQDGFDFSKQIEEQVRNRIIIECNNKGIITDVFNLSDIRDKWNEFRDTIMPKNKLYKALIERSKELADDMKKTGNTEYSSVAELAKTLDKNLFYHVMIRAAAGDSLQTYKIQQYSQLFPNFELTTNVEKTKVKETDEVVLYKLHGELDRSNLNDNELKKMYDKYYKSIIKYNYTEFNYFYIINYTMEKTTNLLLDAKVSLCEKIKNNFEAITEFKIKRVEL